eukprot:4640121-Amphidinium_carterae.1
MSNMYDTVHPKPLRGSLCSVLVLKTRLGQASGQESVTTAADGEPVDWTHLHALTACMQRNKTSGDKPEGSPVRNILL